MAVADLPGTEIAKFFGEHPEVAKALLWECEDKRYTPSTIIIRNDESSFTVAWFTRLAERECVREFENLADAATDYLLFSFGKGRWNPTS